MTNGLDRSIEVQRERVERLRREYERKNWTCDVCGNPPLAAINPSTQCTTASCSSAILASGVSLSTVDWQKSSLRYMFLWNGNIIEQE
jgi:hypothetical protein